MHCKFFWGGVPMSLNTDLAVGSWCLSVQCEEGFFRCGAAGQIGELFLAGDGDDQQEQD